MFLYFPLAKLDQAVLALALRVGVEGGVLVDGHGEPGGSSYDGRATVAVATTPMEASQA